MESIGDARAFLSAAREVALTKPIIVIKAGRSEAASKAAASHTGALTGSDEVLEAAFRRVGVLRVNTICRTFLHGRGAWQAAAAARSAPDDRDQRGRSGGAGHRHAGCQWRRAGRAFRRIFERLNQLLPPHWSHGNPIDILGDAGPERYARPIEIAV